MRLLKLMLRNFKGIKDFTLDAGGQSVSIYGANGLGKTTIFDAFTWLLFDKDSQGKKDFDIKTLDKEGKVLHGLSHEVEGVFYREGRTLTLKKVYAEKWTKKRGQAQAEFTGHTTDHFIDGVPVSKGEYQKKVAEIADESIFKLLTSPSYFNEQLHWGERRKILLEVCGDLTDEEVIVSDKKLAKLPDILQGRKLEDHRKVIAAKRAEINKELEKIPVRIDEAMRALPDITNLVPEALKSDVAKVVAQIKDKQQEIARIENGGEVAEKTKQVRELEGHLLQLKNEHSAKYDDELGEKLKSMNQLLDEISAMERETKNIKSNIESNKSRINKLEPELPKLRDEWNQVNAQQFAFDEADNCPTCGQTMPTQKVEEARQKALAEFNELKSRKLEKINEDGKSIKSDVNKLVAENQLLVEKQTKIETDIATKQTEVQGLKSAITDLQNLANDYTQSPAYIQITSQINQTQIEISKLSEGIQEAIDKAQEELKALEVALDTLKQAQAKYERYQQGQERIEELKAQEKQLAAEFEKLEGELFLTEEFIRTKVAMLEQKINSKFKMARFKLFEQQVNGGLNEVCETTYNGVPYGSGLNNAAKINVGIDIINTLSEHYGFSAPIFVDNRESVTELIETQSQVISLVVSKDDNALRVVQDPKKIKEAV